MIKKKERNNPFKNISYKYISHSIAGYGFDYSFKNHMIKVGVTLAAIVATGTFFYLDWICILILAIAALIANGIIVIAQFRFLANNVGFEALATYMEMMILNYKRRPKILNSLEVTLEYVKEHSDMRMAIEEAIGIIRNDITSEDLYRDALDKIEQQFPCARLHTLHRFLISIEQGSSKDYQDGLDGLYFDIREWITRTYQYQAELKNLKRKITLIMGLSIAIVGYFARVLHTAEATMPVENKHIITQGRVFQLSSLVFLIVFLIIYGVMQTRINGQWLIYDLERMDEEKALKDYNYVERFDSVKERKKAIAAALVCLTVPAAGILTHIYGLVMAGLVVSVLCLFLPQLKYKSRKKAVERTLTKDFPLWLREISVKLNSMVVIRAIEDSIDEASIVLRVFLRDFIKKTEKNPTSISPYVEIIGKYDVAELTTAFKTLYAVQNLSRKDSKRYLNDLIIRNQIMIEKSEKMRNDDSLGSITFISLVPMLLMSIKLIIDMGLLLMNFLTLTKG